MKELLKHNSIFTIITLHLFLGVIFFGFGNESSVIQAQMTDSDDVDITAVVPFPQTSTSGSVANNGPSTTVGFSGYTAPKSRIVILKDGQIFNTFYANENGSFQVTINNQSLGVYNFGLYFEDVEGKLSNILPLQVNALNQSPITFQNIILPPTLSISPNLVNPNQTIIIQGYTTPNSTVYISSSQNSSNLISVLSDNSGKYVATVTVNSSLGDFYIRAKSKTTLGHESIYSRNSFFQVVAFGQTPTTPQPPTIFPVCADPNGNSRVNLIDFSIMLFWYEKPSPSKLVDCNGDSVVNLTDFSVLMYYWTG